MCVHECVRINPELVHVIICHPFTLESPNLDQKCKTPLLRSLLFWGVIVKLNLRSENLPHFELVQMIPKQKLLTILICNSHAIIDEIFRNAPAILIYNSHPILTRQFSSNSHTCNSHLTILIQFSPTILTQFSSTLLSQFSPTMLSQFSRNDQPICSHQSCCCFYSMLIL